MITILDNLRSALNVGSVIRTSDAFGISDIYFCGITPGPDNPKVKKTALGAEEHLKAVTRVSTVEAVQSLKENGYEIIALELTENAEPLTTGLVGDNTKVALVVGNEVSGVAPEVLKLANRTVMIPMRGMKESLNVAVAYGIAAYAICGSKKDL